MIDKRKCKLLNYLFPNEKVRSFLCNDLYIELTQIIPYNLCLSSKNLNNIIRQENKEKVKSIIKKFIKENINYEKEIKKIYKDYDNERILDEIIIGYVFYLANTIRKFFTIDIFYDKKSICYSPISIIDII